MNINTKAYLMIAVGAILWGLIALFIEPLYQYGFTPLQVVALRALSASTLLLLYVFLYNPKALLIKISHIWYFLGTGIISIVLFNWCYFTAIQEMNLSIAVILLYTGPAFVTIMSYFIFNEYITRRKLTALIITLIGTVLVSGLLPGGEMAISSFGLAVGLGSGFFYGLYSIFAKAASSFYSSLTITVYTFLFASLALLPGSGLLVHSELLINPGVIISIIGLGLFSTVLAYLLYTWGLSQVESSRASIMATIEPVVASIVGFFVFQDSLSVWQLSGVMLVLAAVIMIAEKSKRPDEFSRKQGAVKHEYY